MAIIGGIARMAARTLLPQYIRLGLTANASLRAYKRLGYGMRRQTFLNWYRETANLDRARPIVISLHRDTLFKHEHMGAYGFGNDQKYRIWGKTYVQNKTTGEITSQYVSMYDDELRDKDGYETEFMKQFGDELEDYDVELVGMSFTNASYNEDKFL